MFAALEAIKNTLFSLNPLPSTVVHPIDTIDSVVTNNEDIDNDSIIEPMIDHPEPITKESNNVDVFDKRPYTVVNLISGEPEDFHYLHGDNLAQTYDFCLNKSSALVVHICMVAMDFQCSYSGEHLPFLRFLMEYGASTIDFPKCTIMCNMSEDTDESKLDEMDTYFHNECKKRVLDFFVIEGQTPMASPLEFPRIPANYVLRNTSQLSKKNDFGELLNNLYRGYKEIGEGEVVAVFDITDFLNLPLRTSKNNGWMVLDDFENQVLPISSKVLQFLGENKYMKELRDPLNNLVETPKSLYLYDTDAQRFMEKSEKSEWLEPRSFHNTYGNFYYFKQLKTSSSENPQVNEAYRKCVVFLKNYADFLDDNGSVDLMGEHIEEYPLSFDNKLSPDNYRTPTLVSGSDVLAKSEKNNEILSYEEQKKESIAVNNDISQSTDDLELSDDEEHSEQEVKPYEKSDIQNNLPFVSLIMFTENGEPMYCVKTESIFTEI